MNETNATIKFLENYPKGLKKYIEKRYSGKINKIIDLLTNLFNEEVGVHYTFEDYKKAWAADIDFYLIKNKSGYPIATAGKKKVAVCFVIMPPGNKTKTSKDWIIKDEGIYIKKNKSIKWLYKKKVNDISWDRILNKAITLLGRLRNV